MTPLEPLFHRLRSVEPDRHFVESSKRRLMEQIEMEAHERWFVKLLKRLPVVNPTAAFLRLSRVRLVERAALTKQRIRWGLAVFKRITASALVLLMAVMTTLLYVERDTSVSASDITFLEVLSGQAMVKRADRVTWDSISTQTELVPGDLVRIGDLGSAVIHFFDDSQLRLDQNSTVLLDQLDSSTEYARQGVISVYLREGRAWVQTLNVDDGVAQFNLIAPHAMVSSQHASFDVSTSLLEPTLIRSFRRQVEVTVRNPDTGLALATDTLGAMRQVSLTNQSVQRGGDLLSAFGPVDDILAIDQESAWVTKNLERDRMHLSMVRDRELYSLRATTGSVPGDLLYPLKRAKERLKLALPFRGDNLNTTINIANQRLNEAIVLFEQGDEEEAKQALFEYQQLVREIAETSDESDEATADNSRRISSKVVRPHQKAIVAALPGDSNIGLVKQVLDESEELFVDDWFERADLRLKNSLDNLTHVQDLAVNGDVEGAKAALLNHQMDASLLLAEADALDDDDAKKALYTKLLEVQKEESRLLSDLSASLADQDSAGELAVLVDNANKQLEASIEHTVEVATPFLPDVALRTPDVSPINEQVQFFVEKISIYETERGQHNQLTKLFNQYPESARDLTFMADLADQLSGSARLMVEDRMEQVREEDARALSREVEKKIQKQMDLRKKREEG